MIRFASLLVASATAQSPCTKLRELKLDALAVQVRDVGIALQVEIDNHIKARGGSNAAREQVLS